MEKDNHNNCNTSILPSEFCENFWGSKETGPKGVESIAWGPAGFSAGVISWLLSVIVIIISMMKGPSRGYVVFH